MTQLVTLDYLREQTQLHLAGYMFHSMNGTFVGTPQCELKTVKPDKWDTTRGFRGGFYDPELGQYGDKHAYFDVLIHFTGDVLRDGSIKKLGPVRHLSDGTKTTGEYTTITNGGTDAEVHTISKSVTEETHTETHLNESLEISNKISVEADTPIGAKVSDELTTTLGVQKGALEGHSSSTTDSVEATITVPGRPGPEGTATKYTIVFTIDQDRPTQDIDIVTHVDCTQLTITFPFHKAVGSGAWPAGGVAPGLVADGGDLFHNGVVKLSEIDDWIRLCKGYLPGAQGMKHYWHYFQWRKKEWTFDALQKPEHRLLKFKGTQTGQVSKDASYEIVDSTHLSDDEIVSWFGEKGKPVSGRTVAKPGPVVKVDASKFQHEAVDATYLLDDESHDLAGSLASIKAVPTGTPAGLALQSANILLATPDADTTLRPEAEKVVAQIMRDNYQKYEDDRA